MIQFSLVLDRDRQGEEDPESKLQEVGNLVSWSKEAQTPIYIDSMSWLNWKIDQVRSARGGSCLSAGVSWRTAEQLFSSYRSHVDKPYAHRILFLLLPLWEAISYLKHGCVSCVCDQARIARTIRFWGFKLFRGSHFSSASRVVVP
jgi:hypothetical protein